jgi:DNA-binding MarR family transcriptional regulator
LTTPPTAAPEELYDVTAQVGHLLRRAFQRHTALFQQEIPAGQLTAAQFAALCAARDLGACSLSDLMQKTAIDQATIRGIVERLANRALVSVEGDRNDGRKRVIALTPAGNALLDATVPLARSVTEQTFGDLNPAERVALVFLLRKMCSMR